MIDVINDLSELTTIPRVALDNLVDKVDWIIVDALCEQQDCDIIELDLGVGKLQLINRDVLEYRFVPSSKLEMAIKKFLTNGENTLENKLNENLVTKILNVYKEII